MSHDPPVKIHRSESACAACAIPGHDPSLDHSALDEDQREAVLAPLHRPLMVTAVAGSGKTTVLVERTKRILLSPGVIPHQVHLSTYSRSAANLLRMRIRTGLPTHVQHLAGSIKIKTTHSLCLAWLRQHWRAAGLSHKNFLVLDEHERSKIIRSVVQRSAIDRTSDAVARLSRYITQRKSKIVAPCATPGHEQEMHAHFLAYEKHLAEVNALDFDDLILRVLALFQTCPDDSETQQLRNAAVSHLRASVSHMLVDEFQDYSEVQFQLLAALMLPHGSVTVVGDPNQCIYGFRGALPRVFDQFSSKFKYRLLPSEPGGPGSASTVATNLVSCCLRRNYRSSQPIVDFAAAVSNREHLAARHAAAHHPSVSVCGFSTEAEEIEHVITAIRAAVACGRQLGDIAVLVRFNQERVRVAQTLLHAGILCRTRNEDAHDLPHMRRLLSLLRLALWNVEGSAAAAVVEEDTVADVVKFRRGVGPKTLQSLSSAANMRGTSLLRYLIDLNRSAFSRAMMPPNTRLTSEGEAALRWLAVVVVELSASLMTDSPTERLLCLAFELTGMSANTDTLLSGSADEVDECGAGDLAEGSPSQLVRASLQLFAANTELESQLDGGEVQRGSPGLRRLLDYVQRSAEEEVADKSSPSHLTVRTVHGAKGMEWPVVFVLNCVEGSFPAAQTSAALLRGERDIFYVAITRAMDSLVITFPRTRLDHNSCKVVTCTPSPFIPLSHEVA